MRNLSRMFVTILIILIFLSIPMKVMGATTYWINHKYKGLKRRCLVQMPEKFKTDVDGNTSLILVFHGGGGNSRAVEKGLGFSSICDREGVMIAYPEAFEGHWNDGRKSSLMWSQQNSVDDVGFVDFIIKKLRADFGLSERRIYGTGISNGAIFCHYLAVKLPMTFAAIAPVIGSMAENVALTARPDFPLSVLMINGTHDPLVPFAGGGVGFRGKRGAVVSAAQSYAFWKNVCGIKGESDISYLRDKQSNERTVKVISARKGRMKTEVVLYIMIGAGHVWPGRKVGPFKRRIVGKGCDTIDGANLIYSFFERHVRFDLPEKPRKNLPLTSLDNWL